MDNHMANHLTITELVEEAHRNAVEHGFWDDPPELGTFIAMIHSELSEALEELRRDDRSVISEDGKSTPPVYYSGNGYFSAEPTSHCQKPEGFAVELADAVILVASLFGHLGYDLEAVIREKMRYNTTRPKMHGRKF